MHDFIDTMISKQRLCNILFYTGFHETIIATEISTRGGGGGGKSNKKKHNLKKKARAGDKNAKGHKNCSLFKTE